MGSPPRGPVIPAGQGGLALRVVVSIWGYTSMVISFIFSWMLQVGVEWIWNGITDMMRGSWRQILITNAKSVLHNLLSAYSLLLSPHAFSYSCHTPSLGALLLSLGLLPSFPIRSWPVYSSVPSFLPAKSDSSCSVGFSVPCLRLSSV